MLAQGALQVSADGFGGLSLTDQARPFFLRGEAQLQLRARTEKFRVKEKDRTEFLEPEDKMLWAALRRRRKELADEQNVPAYVIFGDATLKEMVRLRPADHYEMARISGVGDRKLEKYGDDFLAVIANQTTA